MYAGVRLSYEPAETENVKNYEIYRINEDNTKSLLAVTTNACCYIDRLERKGESLTTTFEVVAVNIEGVHGKGATTSIEWKDNSLPRADFKASTTLIPEGGTVTFESTSTLNTEEYIWEFEGAEVTTSDEASPTITYQKEGIYKVALTAKNAKGEDKKEIEGFITVDNKAKDGLVNLALGKDTEASTYVNENEAPPFAVDGDYSKKWCATGNPPHTLTIDLGEVKTISQVAIAHAEKGNESPDMNTQKYTIEISTDGKDFTEIVNVTKNKAGMTSDAFKVVDARYVRLVVVKPTQGSDSAARIYEVEVYGLN
jgi:PKD repeat protein